MYSGGSYAAVCGVGDGSHGVEHGISDLCQGQYPPVMEVQVKALSQIKKQFVWRRVSLWSKLDNTKPKKKLALADMGAMVCTVGLNMFGDLGLQKDVMEKTKMVVRRVKRSVLTLGVLTVDVSADGKMTYQIIYVTEET